jgi:hypothetical protein
MSAHDGTASSRPSSAAAKTRTETAERCIEP